ncbi:hypothetical protein QJS10_CPB19g00259 [Acorus calamus]|uniref:Uncharacterized protein n=1 Tax=Acorus calamus TaxID=4465 RepID=A0AAV9CIW3_ACOCL|nr:hypothetical protein QJS10_CPB19g00259 [Acorus calamus]
MEKYILMKAIFIGQAIFRLYDTFLLLGLSSKVLLIHISKGGGNLEMIDAVSPIEVVTRILNN